MKPIARLHATRTLLLAGLSVAAALSPALASPQHLQAVLEKRAAQLERPRPMNVRIDADEARTPPQAARPPVEAARRAIPAARPAPEIADAPTRFEPARRDWRMPRSTDDERNEDWGELARQQQARRQAVEQRRDFEMREQQRQRIEQQRSEQQQRIERLEAAGQARDAEPRRPGSLQAQLIQQAREEQAQRDRSRPAQRPDWQGPNIADRGDRISDLQRQQRIEQQRRQRQQWQRDDDRRRAENDRYRYELERYRRHAQNRYYHDYWQRWRDAQLRWDRARFDDDPFFYAPYSYRYNYGGRWHSTNRYGAELLQQAIRDGYREGWRAGRADRMDRWRFDYQGNAGWIDGSFGYPGFYVSYSDYRWYFRQGFERGYRDGYYDRYQYGRYERSDNGAMILPAVLGLILAFSIH